MNNTSQMFPILGNTYPVKDRLKAIGCRWNPDKKCWMAPPDKVAEATAIRDSAPAKTPYSGSRGNSGFRSRRAECDDCGEYGEPGSRCWETGLRH